MWHFSLLRLLPNAIQNSSRSSLNLLAEWINAAPSSKVSSAKRAWLMLLTPLAMQSAEISCSCIFLFRWKLRMETWRTNRIGERGQPYLSPLEALKKPAALPFTRGVIHGFEMQARIQFIKFSPNPNFCRTFKRKLCLTRSKEFAKFSLIVIHFSLRCWLERIASWTNMKLSTSCLPWIKPHWFSEMILGRRYFSVLAITLVINL